MEEKLYKLYQGQPVSFTWDELEELPHDVFDDESAELIIEAHQGRRGLVLHLTEDEAEKKTARDGEVRAGGVDS